MAHQRFPGTAFINTFLAFVSAGWIIFIAGAWFYRHSVQTVGETSQPIQLGAMWANGFLGRAMFPVVVTGLAFALVCLVRRLWLGRPGWAAFSLSPLRLFVAVMVTALLMLNAAGFWRSIPSAPPGSRALPGEYFPEANAFFVYHLVIVMAGLLAFLLTIHAAGALVLRLWPIRSDDALDGFLFRCAIGLGVSSLFLFGLGAVGLYRWWAVLPGIGAVWLAAGRETLGLLKAVWNRRWEVQLNRFPLETLFFLLMLTMLAINMADLIRPMPVGWDDLDKYMNRARLLADRHALVPGLFPFPVELLTGLGFLVTGSAMPAMAIAWSGGVLTVLAIFAYARRFWSGRVGIVAAAVFYTLPMVGHLSDFDLKTDTVLCFIAIMALRALAEWTEADYLPPWLYLGALLAGVAWTIKITTAFLVVGLSAGVLVVWRCWKQPWRRKVGMVFLACGVGLLPVIPWTLYNLSTRSWQAPARLDELLTSRNPQTLTPSDWSKVGLNPQSFPGTAWEEEVNRYCGHRRGLWPALLSPWDLTMNTYINDSYVVIGFLFLAFLPPLLIFLPWPRWSQPERWLGVVSVGYWLAWLGWGRSIPWYALPGFLPLVVGVAFFLEVIRNRPWLHRLAAGLAVVSVLAHLAFQGDRFCPPTGVQYAAGQIDAPEFIDRFLPGARAIADIIEQQPLTGSLPDRVLRVGTMLPYFITDSDRRLIEDSYLDIFSRLDTGGTDSVTLGRLRTLGIRFVLFDLNVASIEADAQGTLHLKTNRFVTFARQNLVIRLQDPRAGTVLLEVPPAPHLKSNIAQ